MAKNNEPFSFAHLPHVSKAEFAIAQALYGTAHDWWSSYATAIAEMIKSLTKKTLSVSPGAARFLGTQQMRDLVNVDSCIAVLALPTTHQYVAVSVETSLARAAVYHLLGSDGAPPREQQGLSEVEQGIFGYVMLKILSITRSLTENKIEPFILLKIAQNFDEIESYFNHSQYLAISNTCEYHIQRGLVSIFMGKDFLPQFTDHLRYQPVSIDCISSTLLSTIKVPVVTEIASVILKHSEITQLEIDDTIVLEESTQNFENGVFQGPIKCWVGESNAGMLSATLAISKGRYFLTIDEIFVSQAFPPQKISKSMECRMYQEMDEENTKTTLRQMLTNEDAAEVDQSSDGNLKSQELVQALPITLSIELSRISLEISSILQLKRGSIIELNRSPTDLVDIVASGQKIGAGELVDIEGQLGVRIAALTI